MEEHEDGTFKHIWTRVDIKSDETERAWPKNLNIVRPGRYIINFTLVQWHLYSRISGVSVAALIFNSYANSAA